MDLDSAREFVLRDRATVRKAKQSYWAERFRKEGAESIRRSVSALWDYMRQLRPDWPTERDRTEDLAHHVQMKRRIDRAAREFRRR